MRIKEHSQTHTLEHLNSHIHLNRRYSRSVQLERDIDHADAVKGYVITPRAQDVLTRFMDSLLPGTNRSFTITGVYGTGKSSIAHFLTALTSPRKSPSFNAGLKILESLLPTQTYERWHKALKQHMGADGLIRAVTTARREPIHHTVLRALAFGLTKYFASAADKKSGYELVLDLNRFLQGIEQGQDFNPELILEWIQAIHADVGTGILLVIDELGKSFEYAAQYPHRSDLYLLQQLAEYPALNARQGLFVFGLLHQAFSEYARNISGGQFKEWAKVQGRFEDIPFAESQEDILRLMGQSIVHDDALAQPLKPWAAAWHEVFKNWSEGSQTISRDVLKQVYPLHPLSALALPQLCQRYAQNERSLFTFLGSHEPHALPSFLERSWCAENPPTIQLDQIYDYFVESASLSISSHALSQRWLEVQNRLADARHLDPDLQRLLKTIGVLNLVSLGGTFRARRSLVINAMLNLPTESQDADYQAWDQKIDLLIAQKFVNWWERFDELRIWQGSDFDIDAAVSAAMLEQQASLLNVFTQHTPLSPMVAQRHSYTTGTLRYFERLYYHPDCSDETLLNPELEADGFIYYALTPDLPAELPMLTAEGRPIIYLKHPEIDSLIQLGKEHAALHYVSGHAPALRTDTVARREIDHRLAHSKRHLLERLSSLFHLGDADVKIRIKQTEQHLKGEANLRQLLSQLCDEVYSSGMVLWNELINRRELTTQGAKARKELINHMLSHQGAERLNISGYGPERSIFESLLHHTGLYAERNQGEWAFSAPAPESSLFSAWQRIEDFCKGSQEKPGPVDVLFKELQKPPYGVLAGPLPVLLTAFLLCHPDEVSLFQDGAFIPVLGLEHFEILFRHPQRFALKSFAIEGIQGAYFKELEEVLVSNKSLALQQNKDLRNQTVLSLVTPLMRFAKRLPEYTYKTTKLSDHAKRLRQVLKSTKDPSQLILVDLPEALGYAPLLGKEVLLADQIRNLKQDLVKALSELQKAYPEMLRACHQALDNALGQPNQSSLKHQLSQRANLLKEAVSEPVLKRFILAAADGHKEDNPWLESVAMVIADKPSQYWSDTEFEQFQHELGSIKQRFLNFEALQTQMNQSAQNLDQAKRIVLTATNGYECQRIIWSDVNQQVEANRIIDQLLEQELKGNQRLQETVLALLTERLLNT